MIFHIYGSCAGTQPIAGTHHLSFSIEHDGAQYFFDAGECCGYTAHLMNVDICKTKKVVISHTHMDHVGGLGNLFWYIRKLETGCGHTAEPNIDLYIPIVESWDAIRTLLSHTEGDFRTSFTITPHTVSDGVLFDEDGFRVTALHNTHALGQVTLPEDVPWFAYSFLIETEGKRIVYTGDYGNVLDFKPLCEDCDLLLIETGHHTSEKTAHALSDAGIVPQTLAYIHNGLDVRNEPENAVRITEEILGCHARVLHDGDSFSF